jgi:hypothetical protein
VKRFCLLTLLLIVSAAYAADIGLTPPRLELVGRPGSTVTHTFLLLTDAASEQQITSALSDWTLDPIGSLAFVPVGSVTESASAWLELDATDFILEAQSSREMRLSVSIPNDPDLNGTYHGMVFFSIVPPASETEGVGVVTTTQVGLTVYVTVAGTEQNSAELADFYQQDEQNLAVAVVNTGNTVMRLSGALELRDESGQVSYRLDVPDVPVLRESERELTFRLPDGIEPGFYVALALIQDSRGGTLVGELPIQVP